MRKVESFELVDHGIEPSQYFPGCWAAFTPYTDVVTGIGDNPAEAIKDCLEQMANYDGFTLVDLEELDRRMLESEYQTEWPTEPSVCGPCEYKGGVYEATECDGCEMHYRISIRWR